LVTVKDVSPPATPAPLMPWTLFGSVGSGELESNV